MKKVAQGNNPHVITFIGCATLQEPLCLITEFVKYGDLLSYLETMRKLVRWGKNSMFVEDHGTYRYSPETPMIK